MIDKVKEKKVPGFLSWLHAMKSITFPVPFALLCAAVGFVLWITNGLGTNDILSGHRYSDREYRTMETTHTLSYKIFGYLLGFWLVTRLLVCTNRSVFLSFCSIYVYMFQAGLLKGTMGSFCLQHYSSFVISTRLAKSRPIFGNQIC